MADRLGQSEHHQSDAPLPRRPSHPRLSECSGVEAEAAFHALRKPPCCCGGTAGADVQTHQAVQLGHWTLAARLADVPDLHAPFAAGVDVTGGVADGDGAHHFPVAQRVDLASVARDARAYQRVRREGHRLHLSVRAHVERISSAKDTRTETPSARTQRFQLRYG